MSGSASRTGPPEITIPTGSDSYPFFGLLFRFMGRSVGGVARFCLVSTRRQRERFATDARATSSARNSTCGASVP
jgi:hypothetical protein